MEDHHYYVFFFLDAGLPSVRFGAAVQQGADGWCGGYLLGLNKGGGPRVPSRAKMRIYRMPVSMDPAGVSCSDELH
jgi:hypothetical protein